MSLSWVSPGVAYLARKFLSVVAPAASSFIIAVRLASLKGFRVSPWIISVVALGAAPLGFVTYILANEISQRRKASRLGARLVPRIKGKLPGNLDKMLDIMSRADKDYIGIFSCILLSLILHMIFHLSSSSCARRDKGTRADCQFSYLVGGHHPDYGSAARKGTIKCILETVVMTPTQCRPFSQPTSIIMLKVCAIMCILRAF